jgi:hypothetical protein
VHRLLNLMLFTLGLSVVSAATARSADAIAEELQRAKDEHAAAVGREKEVVDFAFDQAIKATAATGKLEAVKTLMEQRKAFAADGTLPASELLQPAVATYRRNLAPIHQALLAAYDKAVKDYTRALKVQDATRVQKEGEDFAAKVKASGDGTQGAPDDPILARLAKAKQEQADRWAKAKGVLASAIDKEKGKAAAKGSLAAVKACETLEEQLESTGTIPAESSGTLGRARASYLATVQASHRKLESAYRIAIRDCVRARNTKVAKALQKELKEGVGLGPRRWLVIFRSVDPKLYMTDNDDSKGLALALDRVPDSIRYLRLRWMETGRFVIIPMRKSALQAQRKEGIVKTYGWAGQNRPSWGGVRLGIFRSDWPAAKGDVTISGPGLGRGNRGWGFGSYMHESGRGQAFGWAGKVLPTPVVFEIAVTEHSLTSDERKMHVR